mmetsp:Transcript_1168/g.3671  ORF Transcript_1168/g.3671 Transcript_1168/m.3671 type:complete len:210 (-) Transcript_1168:831-1460(-)
MSVPASPHAAITRRSGCATLWGLASVQAAEPSHRPSMHWATSGVGAATGLIPAAGAGGRPNIAAAQGGREARSDVRVGGGSTVVPGAPAPGAGAAAAPGSVAVSNIAAREASSPSHQRPRSARRGGAPREPSSCSSKSPLSVQLRKHTGQPRSGPPARTASEPGRGKWRPSGPPPCDACPPPPRDCGSRAATLRPRDSASIAKASSRVA